MQVGKAVAFVEGRGRDVDLPPLGECFYSHHNERAWANPRGRYDQVSVRHSQVLPAVHEPLT